MSTNTAEKNPLLLPNGKSRPGSIFNYISEPGLEKLKEFKYVAGSYTIGDRLMQPFWNFIVTLMPMVSETLLPV